MMNTFIGVKLVQAEPMTKQQFDVLMEREASAAGDEPDRQGYHVVYPDGYHSWAPKDVFEDAYLMIGQDDKIVEVEQDAKITEGDVIAFVPHGGLTDSKLGEKTAVVQATCHTGFEITKTASCQDPADYDQSTGVGIALEQIKDCLWSHLGFVLQWAKYGLNAQNQKR